MAGEEAGSFYRRRGKRLLDLAIGIPALVIASPLAAATAMLVRRNLGSPVLYRQKRPGWNSKPFDLYKFRTMTETTDALGRLLEDRNRLTTTGKFIRSFSLDEIPELVNVLKGDMSLVGPRPLLMQYLGRYSQEQMRRHEVRPGITGLAQVNGRNAISWAEKFRLDIWYVDHVSLWLDLRIMFLTLVAIITRRGISQSGHATMEEFNG